jgi:hypothetical protein
MPYNAMSLEIRNMFEFNHTGTANEMQLIVLYGIYMESGSGGFLADLIVGGSFTTVAFVTYCTGV